MTIDEFYSDKLTTKQREAMHKLHARSGYTWTEFLEMSRPPAPPVVPYVGVTDFHGMFVGIEPDGHTHS